MRSNTAWSSTCTSRSQVVGAKPRLTGRLTAVAAKGGGASLAGAVALWPRAGGLAIRFPVRSDFDRHVDAYPPDSRQVAGLCCQSCLARAYGAGRTDACAQACAAN